ncbi:hypothetical protein PLUTE_a3333 [Pseudoalteromonas luteoviolacea DSM 6061]|nr:hypothetical protein [Pseudoalteromonas luteoviolacea DSM 6061]
MAEIMLLSSNCLGLACQLACNHCLANRMKSKQNFTPLLKKYRE